MCVCWIAFHVPNKKKKQNKIFRLLITDVWKISLALGLMTRFFQPYHNVSLWSANHFHMSLSNAKLYIYIYFNPLLSLSLPLLSLFHLLQILSFPPFYFWHCHNKWNVPKPDDNVKMNEQRDTHIASSK